MKRKSKWGGRAWISESQHAGSKRIKRMWVEFTLNTSREGVFKLLYKGSGGDVHMRKMKRVQDRE